MQGHNLIARPFADVAAEHRAADAACGRDWQCSCAACVVERRGFAILASRDVTVSKMGVDRCQDQIGRLTKCRAGDGTVFYVREALAGGAHSFMVSSGERWGIKSRGASMSRQVLQLATEGDFGAVAAMVREADPHGRAVVRNARFTVAAAERQIGGAK
jgi:hypothetical protein